MRKLSSDVRARILSLGERVALADLAKIIQRENNWAINCAVMLGVEVDRQHARHCTLAKNKANVSREGALLIAAEAAKSDDPTMLPGDPTIDEIYARAAAMRGDRTPVGFNPRADEVYPQSVELMRQGRIGEYFLKSKGA